MSKGIPAEGARSGVYRSPAHVNTLRERLIAQGFAWFEIDCSQARTKQQLLEIFARTLSVPPTFGYNWDALADVLQDLSWVPAQGHALHLRNAGSAAGRLGSEWNVLLEVLTRSTMYWESRGREFIVFIDEAPGLPEWK
jgi:RNAse (barnase) inhibitor barstar